MPTNRTGGTWWGRRQISRKPRSEVTPLDVLERARHTTRSLTGYAVICTVGMIILRATVSIDTFDRYYSAVFVSGWIFLVQTGLMHHMARRELRSSYPDLARELARRRWRLPGSGWAALVYLPLLLMGEVFVPVVLVASFSGRGRHVLIAWMVILLACIIIALLGLLYRRFIRTPYIRLLEQASQDADSAARPSAMGSASES